MRNQRYQLEAAPSFMSYEFISEGPKGRISKLVKYTETRIRGIYNLGFGDKLGDADDVFGLLNGQWREYEKNQNYTAFLIKRK